MKNCTKCLKELPFTSFHRSKGNKDGYAYFCKSCARQAVSLSRDIERHKGIVIARKKLLRDFVTQYLSSHPCVDCGESNIIVLEFDHTRGKKIEPVSVMVVRGHSIKNIAKEIEKCDVRCANCHRIATAKRNPNHWSNRYK